MTSYRGIETVDCVGMQPSVEPAHGLCENHKPNRFLRVERKRIIGSCICKTPIFSEGGHFINSPDNILYQAASVWKKLTDYCYKLTYGYKKQLYVINLTFSMKDFHHLAGFQYLKDLTLPKYNPPKIVNQILDQKIKYEHIIKSAQYEIMVKPRLEVLIHLEYILKNDFQIFSYMPKMYPFTTTLKADYLISSHLTPVTFVFLIRTVPDGKANCDCICCSAFTKDNMK